MTAERPVIDGTSISSFQKLKEHRKRKGRKNKNHKMRGVIAVVGIFFGPLISTQINKQKIIANYECSALA